MQDFAHIMYIIHERRDQLTSSFTFGVSSHFGKHLFKETRAVLTSTLEDLAMLERPPIVYEQNGKLVVTA